MTTRMTTSLKFTEMESLRHLFDYSEEIDCPYECAWKQWWRQENGVVGKWSASAPFGPPLSDNPT
jgi:hypothetical protein